MIEFETVTLITIIYGVLMITFPLIREVHLLRRQKINYKNFNKYKNYYSLRMNAWYVGLVMLFLILTTLFALVNRHEWFLMKYLSYMIALNLFNVIFLILYTSGRKYNKDLSYYQDQYNIIFSSFQNREAIKKQIESIKKAYQSLKDNNTLLNTEFEKYFNLFNEIDHLNQTLTPIQSSLARYEEFINRFNDNITEDFNKGLHQYLHTGQKINLSIEEFKMIDNSDFQNIIVSIEKERKQCIYQFALEKLKLQQVKSSDHLLAMLKKLKELKIDLSNDFTIEIINYAFNRDKAQICNYLETHGLMNKEILCDYIHKKDWAWVYTIPLKQMVKKDDSYDVFQSIILENAKNCAFKILTDLDKEYIMSIKKAVLQLKVNNETKEMFDSIYQIITNDKYTDEANKYENMAVALHQYFDENRLNSNVQKEIEQVLSLHTFEQQKTMILSSYQKIIDQHQDLLKTTLSTIFIYQMIGKDIPYLKKDSVLQLYTEFKKNLNYNELNLLNLLLKTLVLLYENDSKKIEIVYPDLLKAYNSSGGKNTKISLDEMRRYIARSNIKTLTNNKNFNTFKKILNRIENGRMTLEKIVNL